MSVPAKALHLSPQPLRGEPFPTILIEQLVSRLCRGFQKKSRDFSHYVKIPRILSYSSCSFLMEEGAHLLDKRTFKSRQESGFYLPCRYALAILSCAGFCVVYLLRVNLSVALVAMVNSTYADAKASAHDPECQRNTSKSSVEKVNTLVFVSSRNCYFNLHFVITVTHLSRNVTFFLEIRLRSRLVG